MYTYIFAGKFKTMIDTVSYFANHGCQIPNAAFVQIIRMEILSEKHLITVSRF